MNATGNPGPESDAFELPRFSLDVQALDLGADVKAVGLELMETESSEPVKGKEAAEIWAAVFPALAGSDFFVVDFFSHVDRVREFCKHGKFRFAKRRNAAWSFRSLPKSNCGSSSSDLGKK